MFRYLSPLPPRPARPPHWDASFHSLFDQITNSIMERNSSILVKDGTTTYTFEVPGFSKEDLKIVTTETSTGVLMSVKGNKNNREVSFAESIPSNLDRASASAECKDGLLIVKFKDKAVLSDKKEIEIK